MYCKPIKSKAPSQPATTQSNLHPAILTWNIPGLIQPYHLPARMEEGPQRSLYLYGTLTAGRLLWIVLVVKDRMGEGHPWSL